MSRYYPQDTEYFEKLYGYPSEERMNKGAVAVIECNQCIPCNPCENACKKKAISVGFPITNLPKIEEDLCVGCGICVAACPGQSIRIIDKSGELAKVAFPYEYLPLPVIGDLVDVRNRAGEIVGKGKIARIDSPKMYDHTNVVWVEVDKTLAKEVHSIGRKK